MPFAPSSEALREIGGLLLSGARAETAMHLLRAAQWRNALVKVGMPVPLWVVHDVGTLLVAEPEIGARAEVQRVPMPAAVRDAHREWIDTLRELGASEVARSARALRLSDELVAVILLRIVGPLHERHRGPGRAPSGEFLPLDPRFYEAFLARLPEVFARFDRSFDAGWLARLAAARMRIVTAWEQIDLDALRLLGWMGAEAAVAGSAYGMLDVLNVLGHPEANDVVNFSLDLLPSVLETRRATGAQTFGVDGYAGLVRRGTLDSLALSELAFDEETFEHRFAENEVLYHAREKRREEERRLHYIACDATASMRGQRSVFARGLALALAKKLLLRGEDVFFRFFDARLYDVQQARARRGASGIDVPYVLSFKGERGRNYPKVLALLAHDLERLAEREKKTPILYLLTHAECHVPLETIERLRATATLYGVFLLPSTGVLDLEYLPRLHTVQVVDEAALAERKARADRALAIVDDAAAQASARASRRPGSSAPGAAGRGAGSGPMSEREAADAALERSSRDAG